MIRINLLPVSKARQIYTLIWQFVAFLIVMILTIITLFWIDTTKRKDRDELISVIEQLNNKISAIEKQIADHDQIKAKIEKLEKRKEVIKELQARRTGPAYFLVELSNILSRGKGPHIDPDKYSKIIAQDKSLGYNPIWDGRRLWLSSIEEENREVDIKGAGLTTQDVSEFIRRLELSDFFYNVELVETVQKAYDASKIIPAAVLKREMKQEKPNVIYFHIHCKVRYGMVKGENIKSKEEEIAEKEKQETESKDNKPKKEEK